MEKCVSDIIDDVDLTSSSLGSKACINILFVKEVTFWDV